MVHNHHDPPGCDPAPGRRIRLGDDHLKNMQRFIRVIRSRGGDEFIAPSKWLQFRGKGLCLWFRQTGSV